VRVGVNVGRVKVRVGVGGGSASLLSRASIRSRM